MLSLSSLVVAIQGLFGILNGAASLLFPSLAQKTIETLQISLPAVHAIALGSITIGCVSILTSPAFVSSINSFN
ncbi:hypothetical protein N431DRAFT_426512, partial [Stipitochalara longipes BDJ]